METCLHAFYLLQQSTQEWFGEKSSKGPMFTHQSRTKITNSPLTLFLIFRHEETARATFGLLSKNKAADQTVLLNWLMSYLTYSASPYLCALQLTASKNPLTYMWPCINDCKPTVLTSMVTESFKDHTCIPESLISSANGPLKVCIQGQQTCLECSESSQC